MSESQNRNLGFFWIKLGQSCDTQRHAHICRVAFSFLNLGAYSHLRCLTVLEMSAQKWQIRHRTFWGAARAAQSTSGGTRQLCLANWIPALNIPLFQKEYNSITAFDFRSFFKPCQWGSEGAEQPVWRQWWQSWSLFFCWAQLCLLLPSKHRPNFCPHEGKICNASRWLLGGHKGTSNIFEDM